MNLDHTLLIEMYRTMRKIRDFEDRVGELYLQGNIWGAVHLYSGEEAMAVGACMALREDDYITSTHRGHGHCIAKDGDLKRMMAEIFGRATGYCGGKGGSMHIANVEAGNLGANAIVGDGVGIAVGAALASRIKGTDQVAVTFFGDGATGAGIIHEAINLAAVLSLPVVFVCENNQYAVSTSVKYSLPVPGVADRALAYGIPAHVVDGNDVLAVYEVVKQAVERARNGEGPSLIEGKTYRWEGHYKGDPEVYRSQAEVAEQREKHDPIELFSKYLMDENSEAAITGAAVGAALAGTRPVMEIMYMDFITLGMSQIVNQMAKMRYMFGGKAIVPVVVRTPAGGGRGNAAQHMQSLEAWFVHVPGLKVVMPSTPYDVKGLLKSAIRSDDPVIFVENKLLYATRGEVPEEEYLLPIGKADIKRQGQDVTLIATSRMMLFALSAAERLAEKGIDVEVIDPRTLSPLDVDTLITSVEKTGRIVVVHEACERCGVGAEIVAQIQEKAFDYLDGPILRVANPNVPIPFSRNLEAKAIPDEARIISAINQSMGLVEVGQAS